MTLDQINLIEFGLDVLRDQHERAMDALSALELYRQELTAKMDTIPGTEELRTLLDGVMTVHDPVDMEDVRKCFDEMRLK
jgi:hypothetical protein